MKVFVDWPVTHRDFWTLILLIKCKVLWVKHGDPWLLHFVRAIKNSNKYRCNKSKNKVVPDSGSLRLTGCSSSTESCSSSSELRFVSESPLSLLKLTIRRNEGHLRLSSSFSVVRSPVGRLSLRSLSLRRPANLRRGNALKNVLSNTFTTTAENN